MNIIQYENYQEKLSDQSLNFPYLTYLCSIPLDFPRVPLHWHEEMEFIYVKKGRGLVSVDFQPCEVEGGDIVLIAPGQLHTIEQLASASMEYENIIFSLSLLFAHKPDVVWEQFLAPLEHRQVSLPVQLRPSCAYYPLVADCLDQIDQIRSTFPKAYELLIKGKLYELFFHLYHHHAVIAATPSTSSISQNSLEKTKQILKFLEEHYSEKISIQKMAEACGFSQSHFMKFFKQTMGMPFTAYLNDYRLTMASRLLLSSEDSVLAIAGETGFDNLSYFNRVFKQKFRVTPREFRKVNHLHTQPRKDEYSCDMRCPLP